MVVSTLTERSAREVAAEFGDTPGFFQLYTPTDRDLAESLVQRAEAAGYKGIVVTLDTWVPGLAAARPDDVELSAVAREVPGQLLQRSGVPGRLPQSPEEDRRPAMLRWIRACSAMR